MVAVVLRLADDTRRRRHRRGCRPTVDPSNGRKVLYWHDPMVPAQKFDKPGKSPFMDMMLVPVYADGGGTTATSRSAHACSRTSGCASQRSCAAASLPRVEAVGRHRLRRAPASRRAGARDGLRREAACAGDPRPRQPGPGIADVYVPDWVAAQEEFLAIGRMQGKDLSGLADGARQRMRQVGMSDAQIRLVETSGKVQPRLALVAPVRGRGRRADGTRGHDRDAGATLFRINSLSTVWANAEVPESQAALLRPGAPSKGAPRRCRTPVQGDGPSHPAGSRPRPRAR